MDKEAEKRKQRLAELRKRKLGTQSDRSNEDAEKTLSFRSYIPNDEQLRENAKIATPNDIGPTVESETKDLTKETLAEASEKQKQDIDLFNLQPKKPNWDLKRDVEKKLNKLDKRTQRAIYKIIRQRLEGDKDANFAEVVAIAEAQQKLEVEQDD